MWFIGVEVEQETSAPPPKKILDPPLIMHLICPPKLCIAFVFHFSWVLQPLAWVSGLPKGLGERRFWMGRPKRNWNQCMLMQNLGKIKRLGLSGYNWHLSDALPFDCVKKPTNPPRCGSISLGSPRALHQLDLVFDFLPTHQAPAPTHLFSFLGPVYMEWGTPV